MRPGVCPEESSVLPRGRSQPAKPYSAMMAATVFSETCQPASHKPSVIRGGAVGVAGSPEPPMWPSPGEARPREACRARCSTSQSARWARWSAVSARCGSDGRAPRSRRRRGRSWIAFRGRCEHPRDPGRASGHRSQQGGSPSARPASRRDRQDAQPRRPRWPRTRRSPRRSSLGSRTTSQRSGHARWPAAEPTTPRA